MIKDEGERDARYSASATVRYRPNLPAILQVRLHVYLETTKHLLCYFLDLEPTCIQLVLDMPAPGTCTLIAAECLYTFPRTREGCGIFLATTQYNIRQYFVSTFLHQVSVETMVE